MLEKTQDIISTIVGDHFLTTEKSLIDLLRAPAVTLNIDGKPITIKPTSLAIDPGTNKPFARPTTIYDAALKLGIQIPILCHREHMVPVAVCRFCVVDGGPGRLIPACQRQVENGMNIKTAAQSERVRSSVKVLTQLLLSDHDRPREMNKQYGDNELRTIAKQFGIDPDHSPFPRSVQDRGQDDSSLVIAVDHNACILCDRCIRGCNEIRNNQVIGRMNKGYKSRIAFDLNDPMGESSCVSCGECMVSCPTGALTNRRVVLQVVTEQTERAKKLSSEELFNHPLFHGISQQFLGWNEGAVVRRRFKPGEIICREGDFGTSAFIIEQGEVEVFISATLKHAKANKKSGYNRGFLGLVRRFTSGLFSNSEDAQEEAKQARY